MSTFDKVKDIITDKLGVEEEKISAEASFVDDLGADSLDTVELIMQLEEEFGIEIPDEDAETITTVQAAVDYLDSNKWLMPNKRKVVVTGLGALAPNGNTVAEYWKSLISGKSGIGPIESFDADNLSVKIAGELSNFDVQSYFDRKELRKLYLFTI